MSLLWLSSAPSWGLPQKSGLAQEAQLWACTSRCALWSEGLCAASYLPNSYSKPGHQTRLPLLFPAACHPSLGCPPLPLQESIISWVGMSLAKASHHRARDHLQASAHHPHALLPVMGLVGSRVIPVWRYRSWTSLPLPRAEEAAWRLCCGTQLPLQAYFPQ